MLHNDDTCTAIYSLRSQNTPGNQQYVYQMQARPTSTHSTKQNGLHGLHRATCKAVVLAVVAASLTLLDCNHHPTHRNRQTLLSTTLLGRTEIVASLPPLPNCWNWTRGRQEVGSWWRSCCGTRCRKRMHGWTGLQMHGLVGTSHPQIELA